MIENPAYDTMTIVYAAPALEKGNSYTLLTGNTPAEEMHELTTIAAE